MLQPMVVLITGVNDDANVRAARTLRAALPVATVRAHGPGDQPIREASANAHLVFHVAENDAPSAVPEFADATVRTPSDLDRCVRRARAFDERRRAHELPPGSPPSIAPWSPTWGVAARRIGARVLNALASSGVSGLVDHIGSTSVPGLPAKAIIDLQVSVERLSDVDQADAALRSAGFVNVQHIVPDAPGVRNDNPRGGCTNGRQWEKRLYAGVDEAPQTIVHIRRIGAANWRYALLFRDWLRANDDQRDAYARVKADLAAAHGGDANFDAYARAKDYWFDHAYQASEDWAHRTAWEPRVGGAEA
ncbi:MAG: GrpB family protein [Dermabacter sp.]|nr:GrpB family protein [Dermabacter sp.]